MAIIPSSFLSVILGGLVVVYTSPTITSAFAAGSLRSLSLLQWHALAVDAAFAILISFLFLCNIEPKWVARNQSFPFSYRPSWNVGPKSFNFQLLVFEVFHVRAFARTVHVLFLVLEELLWLVVVQGAFGVLGLLAINLFAVGQALSYRDVWLGLCITSVNAAFTGISWWFVGYSQETLGLASVQAVDAAKVALFWACFLRTASHIDEPVPPSYDQVTGLFYPGFGESGYEHVARAPLHSLWLLLLGTVSELGAGLPGRLFNVVVYKGMYRLGYRSMGLCSVTAAKNDAMLIHRHGWAANETMKDMFLDDVVSWDIQKSGSDKSLEG